MPSVTWLASDHFSPRCPGDPCLSHRKQGEDREISRIKLCLLLFEVLLFSPVSLKSLLALFLTQEKSRKINAKFLQKKLLNKNSTFMDDHKGLCQLWWFNDTMIQKMTPASWRWRVSANQVNQIYLPKPTVREQNHRLNPNNSDFALLRP